MSRPLSVLLSLLIVSCGGKSELSVGAGGRTIGDASKTDSILNRAGCKPYSFSVGRVDRSIDGSPLLFSSHTPAISNDGRFVAFVSQDPRIVEGDSNDELDTFVFDRETQQTVRVSISTDGVQGSQASGYVSESGRPAFAADNETVFFPSNADELSIDDNNGETDVYAHHLPTAVTTRIGIGELSPTMGSGGSLQVSSDGRYLIRTVFFHDIAVAPAARMQVARTLLETGQTEIVSTLADGTLMDATDNLVGAGVFINFRKLSISHDGNIIAFESGSLNVETDADHGPDIVVKNVATGVLREIITEPGVYTSGPMLSDDGRFLLLHSQSALVAGADTSRLFIVDLETGSIDAIPNSFAYGTMSGDGRFVAYVGMSPNGETYIYDREVKATKAIIDASAVDTLRGEPQISADGCAVVYRAALDDGDLDSIWLETNPWLE